jgi:hypothetical protein
MARYRHKVTGAYVQVRDDKVMDSSWEPEGAADPAPKPQAQRPTKTK